MSFFDDLGSAFSSLASDVGDQESRDALPPPGPKIALSARLQRFLNTLLGPMNAAWGALRQSTAGSAWDAYGDSGPGDTPARFGYIQAITTPDQIAAAQAYLNYTQWVVPYLEAIQRIVDPGPIIGAYRGQDMTDILEFLQVTENDFTDNTSWVTYALPHLELARSRVKALTTGDWLHQGITYPNPAPALPGVPVPGSYFIPDINIPNLGLSVGVAGFVLVGAGVFALYLFLRRR